MVESWVGRNYEGAKSSGGMKWLKTRSRCVGREGTRYYSKKSQAICADVNVEAKLLRWTLYAAYPTHDSMLVSDDEMRNRHGTADEADSLVYPVRSLHKS